MNTGIPIEFVGIGTSSSKDKVEVMSGCLIVECFDLSYGYLFVVSCNKGTLE